MLIPNADHTKNISPVHQPTEPATLSPRDTQPELPLTQGARGKLMVLGKRSFRCPRGKESVASVGCVLRLGVGCTTHSKASKLKGVTCCCLMLKTTIHNISYLKYRQSAQINFHSSHSFPLALHLLLPPSKISNEAPRLHAEAAAVDADLL